MKIKGLNTCENDFLNYSHVRSFQKFPPSYTCHLERLWIRVLKFWNACALLSDCKICVQAQDLSAACCKHSAAAAARRQRGCKQQARRGFESRNRGEGSSHVTGARARVT